MTPSWIFVSGLITTVSISALVITHLRQSLQPLLTELCGHADRASFWTAFSVVTVGLVPAVFALGSWPDCNASTPAMLLIAEQVRSGLIGLVLSVLALGWIVSRFIPRASKPASN